MEFKIKTILSFPFILLIKIYKYFISPLTPMSCRHIPSCSTYSVQALKTHGPIKGLIMSLKRISKCHPWGTHGYDPVPEIITKKIDLKKYNVDKADSEKILG